MKAILSLIISGALVVSGYAQTRNVLVGTNNAVVQPTNFWSADASNARTGLGLGTAATNPASAFQPASSSLTNLASGDGGALTNLQATNLVGLIPTSNIPSIVLTSIGTITIQQGGTGATNAANARQNLGSTTVGDAVFIATNAAAARTAIGALATNGDAINLTNFPTLLLRTNGNGSGLTNLTAANITGTVALASNVTGTIAISNGGSGASTAGGARTNFGLGASSDVQFNTVSIPELLLSNGIIAGNGLSISYEDGSVDGTLQFLGSSNAPIFDASAANITRPTLGLSWSGLTNTTASGFQTALFGTGTNPVLVNTNGEVVSPTNFWQAAPINTVLQNITNVVGNATNAATNARMLFLYSLAPTVTNVTSTITLPTNGTTFGGDVATITHLGPTSSVTAIRALGAATNIITLNQIEESVRFIYRDNQWKLMDNISYIEPIFFSGTNAAANTAASRTNLGLGTTNTVNFARLELTDTTTNANLWISDQGEIEGDGDLFIGAGAVIFKSPIEFNNTTNAAATRTNLGIPLAALTNTNNANFAAAIELGETNNVTFSNVTASGTLTSTGVVTALSNAVVGGTLTATGSVTALSNVAVTGTLTATSTVTAKTNLVVDGFVDYTAARTNNTPTNTLNFAAHAAWIEVKIGTNSFFLPAYQ